MGRSPRGGLSPAAAAAIVIALLAPATAAAVQPAPGTYRGKTSQKRSALVRVRDDGRVSFLKIAWRAPCKNGKHHKSYTTDEDRGHDIEQPGDGSFSDRGSYVEGPDDDGYLARVKVELDGRFTTRTRARGHFHVKVRIKRHGKFVTNCEKSVKWHVGA